MLRTSVSAPHCRPERIGITGHARAIPEAFIFTTFPVTFTLHFFERAQHRATITREEGARCARIYTQIKATIWFYFQHTTYLMGKVRTHCMDMPN